MPSTPASTAALTTASPATIPSTVAAVMSIAATPTASSAIAPPSMAPPTTEPTMNHAAVVRYRYPRDASPTGVSCESIDCPHGDHVERIAAAMATKAPSTRTVVCTPGSVPGRNSAAPAIVDSTTIRSRPGGEMRHLAQNPDPDHGDVLVDDDLEQYEVEVARLDPELRAWLERGTR